MRRRRRDRSCAVAVLLVLVPGVALADALSVYVEPDYAHVTTNTTDAQGHTMSQKTDEFAHHYRLNLDEAFMPAVRLNATGLFEQTIDWNVINGVPSRTDEWRGGGTAHLYLGSPVLGGDLGYERRDDSLGSSLAPAREHDVVDVYSAHVAWRPLDLPSLDLKLTRTNEYDTARRTTDLTVDDALLDIEYAAFRQLTLGYYLDLNRADDHLSDTRTDALTNSFRGTYQDTYNDGRTTVIASYGFENRLVDTMTSGGVGGLVATPQLPVAGLYAVETFPVTPDRDTLGAYPQLIDGNLTARTTINLGYSVSVGGDTYDRDLGVQFTDPNTPVNMLYVYVDQQLPIDVAGEFPWTVWQSDDNVTWTQVNPASPVVFGAFQNRFEIAIQETRARYLKVVTKPLPVTAAVDRRFSDLFVTELQAAILVPAALARGRTSTTAQSITGALHHQFLDSPVLAYDFSSTLGAATGGGTYVVLNGLSAEQPFARIFDLTARVARQDSGSWSSGGGTIHTDAFQYSAAVAARPAPSLTHALTYTGQYGHTVLGTVDLNAITMVNRAEVYRGVNVFASGGYTYNFLEKGVVNDGPNANATLSVAANKSLTLSTGYFYALLRQTGGGLPAQTMENERIDGTAAYSPLPALYLSATVSRITKGPRPTTLASFGGSFSPFPDGMLLLRGAYTESYDTSIAQKNRLGTASARWTIGPKAWLDLAYTLLDATSILGTTNTRSINLGLVLLL